MTAEIWLLCALLALTLLLLLGLRSLQRVHAVLVGEVKAIRVAAEARGEVAGTDPAVDRDDAPQPAQGLFSAVGEVDPPPAVGATLVPLLAHPERQRKPAIEVYDPGLDTSFVPSYDYGGTYIDATHEKLAHTELTQEGLQGFVDVQGWLHPADALKLYELAYLTPCDVLELGCATGLSSCIISQALITAGTGHRFFTSDLDPGQCRTTASNLRRLGLEHNVSIACADATSLLAALALEGKTFGLVFIDHSHAGEVVADAAWLLRKVVTPGGFALFHDYHDYRNCEPDYPEYGVAQGVERGIDHDAFEFMMIVGCSALYRRREAD